MTRTPLTATTAVTLSGNLAKAIPPDLSEEDAAYWNGNLGELHIAISHVLRRSETNWLDLLVRAENDAHRAFFGQTFDLTPFCNALEQFGEERVDQWASLGLQPHFLPRLTLAQGKLRGWKVKPEDWFWQQVAAGNIKRRNATGDLEIVKEVEFDGTTILIDTRCKPAYDGGRQMFTNDQLLGPTLETLRAEGTIARYEYGEQSSRFGISSLEWDKYVRPALESLLVFEGVSFRLEMAIEANCIPQIYKRMPRKKDGQTDTWVWYEEFLEGGSRRLYGGRSGVGGLAYVRCRDVGFRWAGGAVRPLGVLVT